MKKIVIAISLFVFTLTSEAQKIWTLQECIDFALQNNSDIILSEYQKEIVANEQKGARHNVLPSLNAYGTYYNTSALVLADEATGLIDETEGYGQLGIGAEIDLFKGLYNFRNIKLYNSLLEEAGYETNQKKNDIMISVGTAFMYLLFNKERLNTVSAQSERTKGQLEKSEKLFAAGESTEADVLKLQAQLASEELEYTQIENEVSAWKLELARAMNAEFDTIQDVALGFDLPDISTDNNELTVDSIFQAAVLISPQIQAAKTSVEAKQLEQAVLKSVMLPSLTAGYDLYTEHNKPGYYNSTTGSMYVEPYLDNIYGMFSLSLSVPIFNKYAVKHSIEANKIEVKKAEVVCDAYVDELKYMITESYNDYIAAKKEYEKQNKLNEITKKSFAFVEKQNQVGEISSIDYLIEKNKLNESETGLLVAKYEYLFQRMMLRFYATNLITL